MSENGDIHDFLMTLLAKFKKMAFLTIVVFVTIVILVTIVRTVILVTRVTWGGIYKWDLLQFNKYFSNCNKGIIFNIGDTAY